MNQLLGYVKRVKSRGDFFFILPTDNPDKEYFCRKPETMAGEIPPHGKLVRFTPVAVNKPGCNDVATNVEVV